MSQSQIVLSARNLSREIEGPGGTLSILSDVNFEVARGESVAIVGASGSGKTTLLGLLAGLDLPTAGQVFLEDEELTRLDEDGRARVRAQSVGFVFQQFHLMPALTALENVMLPVELAEQPQARARAQEILRRVGLAERMDHYPRQLSGGEQQRVAIARAFATDPSVLFADEPTGNLDSRTGEQIAELLFELNEQQGTTLVLVTHDHTLAQHCDRVLALEYGQLVSRSGSVETYAGT